MINEQQERFLLLEYQQCAENLRAFWAKRMLVLGVGVTISGTLITQSVSVSYPLRYVYDLCLIGLLFVLIKMLGSLTRTAILFNIRMKEISDNFNCNDFWSIWEDYVKKNPMDSGTASFYIISKFLNYLNIAYLSISYALSLQKYIMNKDSFSICLSVIFIVLTVTIFFINNRMINKELTINQVNASLLNKWNQYSPNHNPTSP